MTALHERYECPRCGCDDIHTEYLWPRENLVDVHCECMECDTTFDVIAGKVKDTNEENAHA